MAELERVCTTCSFCLKQDYGYSNWTTEGTTLHCLKGLNPALEGQEEPWREEDKKLAAALDVAKACPGYQAGTPAQTDVDLEGIPWKGATLEHYTSYCDNPEAGALLKAYLEAGNG